MPQINISIINNLGDGVNSCFSALDSEGRVFFLARDGSLIRPSSGGSAIPAPIHEDLAIPMPSLGQVLDITIPVAFDEVKTARGEGELSFTVVSVGNGTDGLV